MPAPTDTRLVVIASPRRLRIVSFILVAWYHD
jgi:hypothetical protein